MASILAVRARKGALVIVLLQACILVYSEGLYSIRSRSKSVERLGIGLQTPPQTVFTLEFVALSSPLLRLHLRCDENLTTSLIQLPGGHS
jgi:hypothetical protein